MAQGLLWKAGSRKGRSPYFGGLGFWSLLGRKGRPKGAFLKTRKIENGSKNKLFIIGRRLDPLKTVPGSGFEKIFKIDEKTIGKSMVFDGLKPLKSIQKQTLFFTLGHSKKQWKINAKMAPKSHEKWSKMEPGGAQDRFILSFYRFWEKTKKLDFSMRFRGDQKTRKIDPWSAKGSKKAPRVTTSGRLSRQGVTALASSD